MKRRNGKFTLRLILDFYDAWLREDGITKVAAAMGVDREALHRWLKASPEMQMAKELAESRRGNRSTLSGYIYGHLSKEGRAIWDQIDFWKDSESLPEKVEALLEGKCKKLRQELFVHALISSNFDPSSACRMTGVSRTLLCIWKQEPEFQKLVAEIQWHKKNFFESALIDLVEQRHPGAVVFVNRTINRDRGYSESIDVRHSVDGPGASLDDLDLDLDTRRKILDAIRRKKEKEAAASATPATPQLPQIEDAIDV